MDININQDKIQVPIKSDIPDNNCSYCNKRFTEELWCKDCDPFRIIEGWTSRNPDIDEFIKVTMYNARHHVRHPEFLEFVPFDRFTDVEEIDEGGFAKVYTATWIDGPLTYKRISGSWKKLDPEPKKVALKRLNGSQNISAKYLNEVLYSIIIFV